MNVIRTIAQLLLAFADNTLRLITPQDARNFIVSSFGAFVARDPTVTDDNNNTGGEGYFDVGSWWANTVTQSVWRCWDGTTGAAVWKEVAGTAVGNPPIGSVEYVMPYSGSTSGLPVIHSHHLVDAETLLVIDSGANVNSGPWVVHSGPWTRPTWYTSGTIFSTDVIVEVIAGSENDGTSNAPAFYRIGTTIVNFPPSPWTVDTDAPFSQLISIGSVECNGDSNITITPSGAQLTNPGAVFNFSLTNVPAGLISGVINIANIPAIPVTDLTGPGTLPLDLLPDDIPWSDLDGTCPDDKLPDVGGGAGSFGSPSKTLEISVDDQGRVTDVSAVDIAINASQVTGGTLSAGLLPTSGATAGTYGDATHVGQFTVDNTGRITSASNVAIAIPFTAVTGNIATSQGPSSGVSLSKTYINGVTCSGGSLVTTTGTVTSTNGFVTGLTYLATYRDGVKICGKPEAPLYLVDALADMEDFPEEALRAHGWMGTRKPK